MDPPADRHRCAALVFWLSRLIPSFRACGAGTRNLAVITCWPAQSLIGGGPAKVMNTGIAEHVTAEELRQHLRLYMPIKPVRAKDRVEVSKGVGEAFFVSVRRDAHGSQSGRSANYFGCRPGNVGGIAELSASRPQCSASQRYRISRDEFDKISLPGSASLLEQARDMGPDRGFGHTESTCYLRNSADLDDREQHAELGRRQFEGTADGFRRG